jgi:O-antigen/teichoic acid export membrane protein
MASHTLARGASINLAGRIVVICGGLLLMTLVARLGTEQQGAFALFLSFESILLSLFSGLGLVLARERSRSGSVGGPVFDARLQGTMLCLAVAVGVMAALVLASVSRLSTQSPYNHLWMLALGAPWLLAVPTAMGAWMGQGRLVPLNVSLGAVPVLVPVMVLVLMAIDPALTVWGVLGAWLVGKGLVGLATLAASWREVRWARPAWALTRPHWGFIAIIGATNLVSLLNYRVNLFMVERIDGLSQAGVYSVSVSVAELLWFVSSSITTAVYHRIGATDGRAAALAAAQAMRWSAIGVMAAIPLMLGVAWWAFPNVLGAAYGASWWPLALLMPGTLAYSVASAVSAYFTNHLGKPQLAGRIAAMSMLSNLLLSWVLVPRLGIAGAALSTSLSYTFAIAVGLWMFFAASGLPVRALWSPRSVPA